MTVIGGMIAAGGGGIAVYTQLGVTQQRRDVRNEALERHLTRALYEAVAGVATILRSGPGGFYAQELHDAPAEVLAAVQRRLALIDELFLRSSGWDRMIARRVAAKAVPGDSRSPDVCCDHALALLAVRLYLARRLRSASPTGRLVGWFADRREMDRVAKSLRSADHSDAELLRCLEDVRTTAWAT